MLAWLGEHPIGIMSGIIGRETGHHELVGMWVDLEHRGTPAATLLVDRILAWAKDSNARLVTPLSLNRR